jgi:1,2-diacylglycerol 3-alpha-glucosyltransferase
MKLGILLSNIGPYHRARLEAVCRLGQVGVIDCSIDQGQAYQSVAASESCQIEQLGLKDGDFKRLSSALERLAPDVLAVPGWSFWHSLAGLQWALRRGVPTVVFSDSLQQDGHRRFYKEWVKRRILRHYDAALAAGTEHIRYLGHLGFPMERCFTGVDVVDNSYFAWETDRVRSGSASSPWPAPYFLAVNRLVATKNVTGLLEAYARYREQTLSSGRGPECLNGVPPRPSPWPLVVVGTGPIQGDLIRLRSRLGLEESVIFAGHKSHLELPACYAHAGALVLASHGETWGLVVNEAMASGLPVLVSDRCGCAGELVRPGRNGFQFDPQNLSGMAEAMAEVAADNDRRATMGAASRAIIAEWGPDRFARNLWQAVNLAHTQPRHADRRFDRLLLRLLLRRG